MDLVEQNKIQKTFSTR